MIPNLKSQRYVIRPGDNISAIARKQGYSDWKVIYNSKCNEALRRQRPNPNLIQPGDTVMLPPGPAQIAAALQARLSSLQQIRRDTESTYAGAERSLCDSFNDAKSRGEMVDTANTVINILTGVGKMMMKGAQAMGKAGEELAKANKELAFDAIQMPLDQVNDVVMKEYAGSLKPEKGLSYAVPRIIVQSWLDMTSPSYWANVYVQLRGGASWSQATTTRLEDIQADALAKLRAGRHQSISAVDDKIRETNRLLSQVQGGISSPLPLK